MSRLDGWFVLPRLLMWLLLAMLLLWMVLLVMLVRLELVMNRHLTVMMRHLLLLLLLLLLKLLKVLLLQLLLMVLLRLLLPLQLIVPLLLALLKPLLVVKLHLLLLLLLLHLQVLPASVRRRRGPRLPSVLPCRLIPAEPAPLCLIRPNPGRPLVRLKQGVHTGAHRVRRLHGQGVGHRRVRSGERRLVRRQTGLRGSRRHGLLSRRPDRCCSRVVSLPV